jgi:hypothetical protein
MSSWHRSVGQEIFAGHLLPKFRFPDLINDNRKLIADSLILPDESLASVPEPLRAVTPRLA